MHKTTTFLRWCFCRTTDLSHGFAYSFYDCFIHKSHRNSVYLNPKKGEVERHILNCTLSIIALQSHEVFIKTPWLIGQNAFNSIFVIESEKDEVISNIFDFKTILGSLKRLESSSNSICIECSLCKKNCC